MAHPRGATWMVGGALCVAAAAVLRVYIGGNFAAVVGDLVAVGVAGEAGEDDAVTGLAGGGGEVEVAALVEAAAVVGVTEKVG